MSKSINLLQSIAVIGEAIDKNITRVSCWQDSASFRIFHGRGGCFPGAENFAVDIFFPAVLVTAYQPCDTEFLQALTQALVKRFQHLGFSAVLFQFRAGRQVENTVLYGEVPQNFVARYAKLNFKLSFTQQNLGYFLDINPARHWLAQRAQGAKVLNLFSYTCAFSVIASQAGAASVVNIDLSAKSLGVGRDNYRINHLPLDNVHFFAHDIFRSWGKLKRFGPYDITIIDPPSRQKGSFIEGKDYEKIWQRMSALVAEGGWVLSCLNSPLVKRSEFKQRAISHLTGFTFVEELPLCPWFPEKQADHGLKMLVFRRLA